MPIAVLRGKTFGITRDSSARDTAIPRHFSSGIGYSHIKDMADIVSKPTKAKCDKLLSAIVRERDGHKCRLCGRTEHLQVHHIMRKKSYRLRYCLENCITLCPSCHLHGVHANDYTTAGEYQVKVKQLVGQLNLDALELLKQNTVKYTLAEAWEDLRLAQASMASKGIACG